MRRIIRSWGFVLLGIALLSYLDDGHLLSSPRSAGIPPVPYYYVLDQPKSLDATTRQSLEALLIEHDRLTGEQFMIAILDQNADEVPKDWPHQIFKSWGIGNRSSQNGILLTVFWKNRQAQFEVGYGLEPTFTPDKQSDLLSKFIRPRLKKNQPQIAMTSGVFRTLEALNSPLIQSGKAAELLVRIPGISGVGTGPESSSEWSGWIVLFIAGVVSLVWILHEILSREAHFTRSGWHRIQPIRLRLLIDRCRGYVQRKSFRARPPHSRQPSHLPHLSQGGTRGYW